MARRARIALCAAALIAFGATSASRAAAAECPNEGIRAAQTSEAMPSGTTSLPACMALEMVSAPKKFGQEASQLSAFSPDGTRALFNSKAALAETEGLQAFVGDSYVGTRTAGGWALDPTSAPREAEIVVGGGTAGGPYAFGPDLGNWVLFGGTQPQKLMGEGQIFNGALGGAFSPLSPLLAPIDNSGTEKIIFLDSNYVSTGTAADLSATVFKTLLNTTSYLPDDPRSPQKVEPGKDIGPADESNSYVAFLDSGGEPGLELLARDQAGTVYGGLCGSRLGGSGGLTQGAISADGSRIYFSTRPAQPWNQTTHEGPACSSANPVRIFKRTETPTGPDIAELIPGEPAAVGDDLYQGASLDGEKVFLATPRKLSASDVDPSAQPCSAEIGSSVGCDLYLYDGSLAPGERLIQASAGGSGDPTPGKGANVLSSVTAISPDGSHAYFAAQGVLTTDPNPEGATAQAGKPNLYLYERDAAHPAGHTAFVGTLAPGDKGQLWAAGSFTGGAYDVPLLGGAKGGDGHILFLLSKASLTADDADGGFADVFRYDAEAGTLQCVSCAPGGPDAEHFDVEAGPNDTPPTANFAEQGRWASEDGETATFATAEPIEAGDADAIVNPYLWKEGLLARLPGEVANFQQLPVVSLGGEEVGFTSVKKLLPQDGDTSRDAYLVRSDGGFPNPPPIHVCDPLSEGSCPGAGTQPGTQPTPTTGDVNGPGNVKPPAPCKKGFVRKNGKCVKQHKAKKKNKSKQTKKRASHKQGGKK